ncbi:WYL domain-containing protein [Streptomyces sp. UP1A-1]|nr:WYL domain-containing protein [Streptomyces sp. UP1A-1]
MFALTRLRDWTVLDTARRLRPGADLAGTARELGEALESREQVVVTARLDGASVDLARRILGARLRTVGDRQDGDGRVEITVAYGALDGVRQLLQFSDHIEVVAPEPSPSADPPARGPHRSHSPAPDRRHLPLELPVHLSLERPEGRTR